MRSLPGRLRHWPPLALVGLLVCALQGSVVSPGHAQTGQAKASDRSAATPSSISPSADVFSWRRIATLPDTLGVAGACAGVSTDVLLVAGGANFPEPLSEGGEKAWSRLGIDAYEVLDHTDGKLRPTLEVRRDVIRLIREWQADVVVGPRPNDYHPDHRYAGRVIQDAAYLVQVPNTMPEVRERLETWYPADRARQAQYAESFQLTEYGRQASEDEMTRLFSVFPDGPRRQ